MDSTEHHSKNSAILRISLSRQNLLKAIEGLNEVEMTQPDVEGIWSIKDLLGHLASWEEVCLTPLKAFLLTGIFQPKEIPDHNAWNAIQAEKKRSFSTQETLMHIATVRQDLMAEMEKLTEQHWEKSLSLPWGETGTPAEMLSGLAWHEDEHTKTIVEWKGRKRHE